ncbi:acetyl-CoA C-acetyltransferase [Paenibacillus mendelii]|uniref:acetyl-CoA C-acetyltransferase n=1 Tax=Paenibacillus mendelii TaxID=206163 RepID=A0ABV6JG29_9BACL|nr:acetyl-CoA C-acetyltransferase [Paenibacillus mendelii]MCQ6557754.1 acetyl-CoA C-acetyltransferase [Paenibacillus mendelii]
MRETVIVEGARTAFGRFGGVFKGVSAAELGAAAIQGALHKAAVDAAQVEGALMGMVLQAGAGQIPSRQSARLAGLDWSVPSETINKVCASGLRAITLADQIIRSGDADTLVAGGMESMSSAPYAVPAARWGSRMGDSSLVDLMIKDGLWCAFANVPMGVHGSRSAVKYGISREEQDGWALRSHLRAVAAIEQGIFKDEIVPCPSAGHALLIDSDECPRADTDAGQLARLKPIFDPGGSITAGNAPGVNDGAAAMILMSREASVKGGHRPLATIIGHAAVGSEAPELADTPAMAIRKLLVQTGFAMEDIHLFEVNEAFAAVLLITGRMLGWDDEKVNIHGGAIALGHPIGASGARILLTLINGLRRRGGGLGIAAICSGGAQGDAILIRVDS